MKVDVIYCFYKQHQFWDKIKWGISQNKDHINKVILVNDGPVEELDGLELDDAELVKLGHKKEGWGWCTSANQGIEAASTYYVQLSEGDCVLAPKSLEISLPLLLPTKLLSGPRPVYVDKGFAADNRIEIQAKRERIWKKKGLLPTGDCLLVIGGHMLMSTTAHKGLGGFDERFKMGWQDYDYGLRWGDVAFRTMH
jgi:GT2 family glycosyltransferase